MDVLNKKAKFKKYKLRAECLADILTLLKSNKIDSFKMERESMFPDIEFEFTSPLNLGGLHKLISEISDGHVMAETLKKLK